MLRNLLYIMLGGAIGSALRYLVGLACLNIRLLNMPWGTLVANIAGCLLLGLIWGWLSRTAQMESQLALFLTIGICGGFTTFSTFSKEALMMLQNSNYWAFVGYVTASIVLGIAFVAVGYMLTK